MYLALRRVTRKYYLSLIGSFNHSALKVDKDVIVAYNKSQEEKKIKIIDLADIDANSLTISLLTT